MNSYVIHEFSNDILDKIGNNLEHLLKLSFESVYYDAENELYCFEFISNFENEAVRQVSKMSNDEIVSFILKNYLNKKNRYILNEEDTNENLITRESLLKSELKISSFDGEMPFGYDELPF